MLKLLETVANVMCSEMLDVFYMFHGARQLVAEQPKVKDFQRAGTPEDALTSHSVAPICFEYGIIKWHKVVCAVLYVCVCVCVTFFN